MPNLIVEQGQGLPGANAYITVEYADEYHDNMGHDFWTQLTRNQKMSCIIRATMYIDQRFKRRYRGLRQGVDQSLGWPRIGAYDDDSFVLFGVPYQIERACAEYALRASYYQQLAPDPLRTVPSQDFRSPPNGVTPGMATYTGTGNFNDGDVITIGTRSYLLQTVLTPVDGHVLIGGSLAASLMNLSAAINFVDDLATGLFNASVNFSNNDTITIGGNVGSKTYTFQTVLTQVDGNVLIGSSLAISLFNLACAINGYGNAGQDFYVIGANENVSAVAGTTSLLVTATSSLDIPDIGVESPLNVVLSSNTASGAWVSPNLEIGGSLGVLYYVNQADPNVTSKASLVTLGLISLVPAANSVVTLYTPDGTSQGAFGGSTVTGYAVSPDPVNLVMGPVRTISEKIGPLEETTTYDGLAALAAQNARTTKSVQSNVVNDIYLQEYPEADLWLEPVLRNPATGTRLVRGS